MCSNKSSTILAGVFDECHNNEQICCECGYDQKIKLEIERINNTALRAEVQSINNIHMVFANEEHEKFYYETLK